MPAQAGIQGGEGMDTGFRRYVGSFVQFVAACLHMYFQRRA